jgi:hypothetical protein
MGRMEFQSSNPPNSYDDGVLAYGPVYVLKKLPRRLKAKML